MKTCRSFLIVCAILGAGVLGGQATTVIPPSFDELAARAEVIFQGTVTNVQSQWIGQGDDRHIETYVTFRVDDSIKGNPGLSYTIQMLGGTVGNETMSISDAPVFKKGDCDILFVEHNGQQFIPLVGIMHGRYRIQKDKETGRDIVANNEGAAISDPKNLGKGERIKSESNQPGISPNEFKTAIQTRLRELANAK